MALNVDYNNNYNNRRLNVNADNRPDNAAQMVPACILGFHGNPMKTYRNLYARLCSYDNLELAYNRARKHKTTKGYVLDFEEDLEGNLNQIKRELEAFTYVPKPMTTFIVRDPKTRTISSSHFRDRVVHHAICNVIEPIFEREFIYDSFANQKGKGVHLAIKRLQKFMRKVGGASPLCFGGGKWSLHRGGYSWLCAKGRHTPLFRHNGP